jgi:hypothetical protein
MRKLFVLGVSSLFLGSPAMSAVTYSVNGASTGNEGEASSGDTPRSVGGRRQRGWVRGNLFRNCHGRRRRVCHRFRERGDHRCQ